MTPMTHTHRPKKSSGQNGFSLIELMFAISVLAVGMAALLPLFATAVLSNGKARTDTTATMLAQTVLEKIAAQPASGAPLGRVRRRQQKSSMDFRAARHPADHWGAVMKSTCQQRGFTLIEMMITVAVLTIVLGTVVTYISRLQRVYKTQETNVDSTDEGRMFLDNIERELHQSGYPNKNMYTKSNLNATPANDVHVGAGLVNISKWNIYLEGD